MTAGRTIVAIFLLLGCSSTSAALPTDQQVPGAKIRVEAEAATEISVEAYNDGLAGKGGEYCASRNCESGPTLLRGDAPVYPAQLLRAGIEGKASVMFDIDTRGIPQNIAVHSATEQPFGVAAAEAVENWRFQPARLNGRPVVFEQVVQIFPFELRD